MLTRHHAGHHPAAFRHIVIVVMSRDDRDGSAGVAQMQAGGFADANASADGSDEFNLDLGDGASAGFGSSGIVSEARRYLGGNPTGVAACGARDS